MTKIKPHWQILAALVLATLTAFLFRGRDGEDGSGASGFISGAVKTFEFLGKDIFMNLLKMIIVPLIVSSVVAGIASLHGMEGFGRMLGKTAGFYAFLRPPFPIHLLLRVFTDSGVAPSANIVCCIYLDVSSAAWTWLSQSVFSQSCCC